MRKRIDHIWIQLQAKTVRINTQVTTTPTTPLQNERMQHWHVRSHVYAIDPDTTLQHKHRILALSCRSGRGMIEPEQ